MEWFMSRIFILGSFIALFIILGMMIACGDDDSSQESKDNFNSQVACNHYCAKHYDCKDVDPTDEETSDCVSGCRNDIEDNCGNDNQQAANDKIEECVDKSCTEFGACMVFDAAPTCFGFVDENTTDDDTN
jgi:hypothetical protein